MTSRLRKILAVTVLFAILAWTVWPIVSVAIGGSIASANGCTLNESGPHPCIVNGKDIGSQLLTLGMMGWLMLVTVPTGLIALAVYAAILLITWLVRRSKRARSLENGPA